MRFYMVSKSPLKILTNDRGENKVILQQTNLADVILIKRSNTNEQLLCAISQNATTTASLLWYSGQKYITWVYS